MEERSNFARFYQKPNIRYSKLVKALRQLITEDATEQFLNACVAFVTYNNIPGDYYEFGVYRPRTMIWVGKLFEQYGNPVKLWGFDSFEGLPDPKGDKTFLPFYKGQYAYTWESADRDLTKAKIKDYELIKVWFDKLQDLKEDFPRACMVLVDCDLYESTRDVLEFMRDKIGPGTLLLFDDWYTCKNWEGGEQKAFYEWKDKYNINVGDFKDFAHMGKAFIILEDVN